jgi:hypothetical protein
MRAKAMEHSVFDNLETKSDSSAVAGRISNHSVGIARFSEALLLAAGARNFHLRDHFTERDSQFLLPRTRPRHPNGSDKLQMVQMGKAEFKAYATIEIPQTV